MKVTASVRKKDQKKVKISDMQVGFRPAKETTDTIFTIKQMQEKHGNKGKKIYYAFADLEKTMIQYLER